MLQPLADRVVIEPLKEEETTASGIVLPEKAKEKPTRGKVLSVGKGRLEKGKLIELELRPGDIVLYNKYAGTEVKWEGKELLIMRESDVTAILESSKEKEKELVTHG